jgi:hypothetical protein
MVVSKNKFPVLMATLMWLFICACNNGSTSSSSGTEEILKSIDGGDFRGVNMGDKPQDVMDQEGHSAVYSMPDELVYRLPLSKEDSTWYEISYNFNDVGLYDISMEVFAQQEPMINRIHNECVQHYAEKYGAPTLANGNEQWRAMTEKGSFISITITDSILRLSKPCMTINFSETPKP